MNELPDREVEGFGETDANLASAEASGSEPEDTPDDTGEGTDDGSLACFEGDKGDLPAAA